MKKLILLLTILFTSLLSEAQLPELLSGEVWVQCYADDFNDLNPQNWIIADEFDHYGNIWVAIDDNVYIENGNLVIKAEEEIYNCITPVSEWSHQNPTYNYTTGFLTTNNTLIHYGYIEARVKCPYFNSVNSAFWTFKADHQFEADYSSVNEIDIFENLGWTLYNMSTSNVHLNYDTDPDRYRVYSINDYRNYHVYGCEWTPTQITFYIDGILKRTIPNPGVFDPVKVIFNIGFGTTTSAVFPYYMYVDYLKIWGREKTIENRTLNSGTTNDFASYAFNIAGNGGSYTVNSGAINELYATKSITLKPGFKALNGSQFTARVDHYTKISQTKSNNASQGLENLSDKRTKKETLLITQKENEMIKIWPNPAQSTITVTSSEMADKIQIYTLSGQKVFETDGRSTSTSFDISNIVGGIYIVKVLVNSNLYTEKLIINKQFK